MSKECVGVLERTFLFLISVDNVDSFPVCRGCDTVKELSSAPSSKESITALLNLWQGCKNTLDIKLKQKPHCVSSGFSLIISSSHSHSFVSGFKNCVPNSFENLTCKCFQGFFFRSFCNGADLLLSGGEDDESCGFNPGLQSFTGAF